MNDKIAEWLQQPEFHNARFTTVFCSQLDTLTLARVVNPFAILDEIRVLEGFGSRRSRTKPPSRFKGRILSGLMHKHFFNARHIVKNLQNYWTCEPDKITKAIAKVAKQAQSDDAYQLAGAVANRLVSVAFEHKNLSRSLTGDWIVYKIYNHRNYYLCLANHDECEGAIYDRLASAAEREFPELGIRERRA